MARFLLAAASIVGVSCLVAWRADDARWSAVLLHAEPLLLVGLAVAAYVALTRRQRGAALGLVTGAAAAFVILRLPSGAPPVQGPAPRWTSQVAACTAAIPDPTVAIDLLQWRVPAETDPETLLRTVQTIGPDVAVLYNVDTPDVLEALVTARGGEYHLYPPGPGGPGFGVYTAGEFSLCDQEDEWTWGLDTAGGYAVAFVGLGDGATFPLVVTRFPGPLDPVDFALEMDSAEDSLQALLEQVRAPTTLVVADGPVTDTYRHLLGRFTSVGLRRLPLPPNWPARVAGVPLIPLHAYARAWAGPAWTVEVSRRVAVGSGPRAPVWTRVEPSQRRAAHGSPPPRG